MLHSAENILLMSVRTKIAAEKYTSLYLLNIEIALQG